MKMPINKKLQKGKGKRIKLQWQYRVISLIQSFIDLPKKIKRLARYHHLLFKRTQARIDMLSRQEAVYEQDASARAYEVAYELMKLDRPFNM
jgi:hypothetical protein